MREIKFRAWHSNQNKMFSAEEMAIDQLTLLTTGRFINVSGASQRLSKVINSMIPLQYTGFSDKHSVEVYDGDIIQHCITKTRFVIYWDQNGFAFKKKRLDNGNTYNLDVHQTLLEVIGNIYQNPELIEQFQTQPA